MLHKVLALVIFTGLFSVASAQDTPHPLLIQRYDSGLWTYQSGDDTAEQLSAFPCGGNGIISPDAKYVACTELTEGGFDIGLDEFTVANNLVLLDVTTDSETTLTTQPDDMSKEHFIVRSQPTWSPDSTKFAWAEFYYPAQNQSVYIYDVASGETTTLLSEMASEGDSPLASLEWGEGGIVYDYNVFETSGDGLVYQSVTILTPDGTIRYAADVDIITPRVRYSFGGMWLKFEASWQYAELFNDGTWQVFDPETQATRIVAGHIELRSTADNAPLAAFFTPEQSDYVVTGIMGEAAESLTKLDYLFSIFDNQVALSPDGAQVAFIDERMLKLWDGADVMAVPLSGDDGIRRIVWGDTYFALVED